MDIKPHPEKNKKVVVAVDDEKEEFRFNRGRYDTYHTPVGKFLFGVPGVFRGWAEILDPTPFPHNIEVTRKQLGRIAGGLLAQGQGWLFMETPEPDDIALAGQIASFFEEQVQTTAEV